MKKYLLLALILTIAICGDHWAVLVAGSNTWSNYRHQADVYHAYQVLIKNGFDADKIITLAYDDIAHHLTNPFKGKVFNKPTYKDPGVDVYAGVKIDYSKNHVTP
jgi:legumain